MSVNPLEIKVDLLWYIGKQVEKKGRCSMNVSLELPDEARYSAFQYLKQQDFISTVEERCKETHDLQAECRLTDQGRRVYQQIKQGYHALVSSLASELP